MTLRIQSSTEGKAKVFALCGRIREDQVPELEAFFASASVGRDIILDLTDVKLVDRGAVRFLAQRETRGIQLRNCPAYIREWISRENSNQ